MVVHGYNVWNVSVSEFTAHNVSREMQRVNLIHIVMVCSLFGTVAVWCWMYRQQIGWLLVAIDPMYPYLEV